MNWIVITTEDEVSEDSIVIKGIRSEHIQTILKKSVGDSLKVILPGQKKGLFEIISIEVDSVTVTERICENEYPLLPIHLTQVYFAMPRPQTGKKILFLSGVYGLGKINFIYWNQKNKQYLTSPLYNGKELQDILDGMSQSGNPIPSQVSYSTSQSNYLKQTKDKLCYVFDPSGKSFLGEESTIKENWQNGFYPNFLFGPESGFTLSELDVLRESGHQIVSLGNVILRTEHAFHGFLYQMNVWLEADPTGNKKP
jgi:RsmE family RNA methyltransferase